MSAFAVIFCSESLSGILGWYKFFGTKQKDVVERKEDREKFVEGWTLHDRGGGDYKVV